MLETKNWKECSGMRSSGHQMAIALMNLQHLWISAQDLCRVKPPETPTETGAKLLRSHTQLRR